MKNLANEIFNTLQDLDFLDYAETNEKDLKDLTNDLELLKKSGNGALLNAIKNLIEQ
jgi:hypothetical protein